ncbi:MAG: hypothetical protein M3040_07760 [Bacteroidota bacterium]|nr:hypothetical protein [Bacteroidota bacterium]
MKRPSNGFARQSWAVFRKQLDVIVAAMTGNANFPTLQTQVTALSAAADKYYVLDSKAETRDKTVLLARNTARIEITNLLHLLGFAITSVALGNEEVLSTSGFPISKAPQKSSPLQQPKPPRLSAGINNGVIVVKTASQKGMKSLKYYIAPAVANSSDTIDESAWEVTSWNSTKYNFSDLTSGQRYFIKVGMVGVRGQEVVSDPISFIPQ